MARARRQPDLPVEGMSRIERPEVEEPAEDLRSIRGEIATLNERKRNAQGLLRSALQAVGITVHKYVDPDGVPRIARIKDKPGVSVERDKSAKKADSDGPPGRPEDDDGGVEVS